jgi:ankyrin repeat protein
VCTLLIDLGASLDATDDYGQKPIHLAAQSNKATVVKTLLKQRPNLVRKSLVFLFNFKTSK